MKLTDNSEESSRETADHIDVLGKTRSGAVVTADISAGVAPQDVRSSFDISGSEPISKGCPHQPGYALRRSHLDSAGPLPAFAKPRKRRSVPKKIQDAPPLRHGVRETKTHEMPAVAALE